MTVNISTIIIFVVVLLFEELTNFFKKYFKQKVENEKTHV